MSTDNLHVVRLGPRCGRYSGSTQRLALVEDAAVRATGTGGQQVTIVAHPRNFPFYEVSGSLPANMCKRASGRRYGCGANSREAAIS
jgi:hypothetical protein